MPKLTLLTKFSVISLVLLAAIGALLGWALTRHSEEQAVEQQKVSVSSLVLPVIGPFLDEGLFKEGAQGERYSEIEHALSFLGRAGLVRVKVWTRDGKIVYSDSRELIGQRFEVAEDLQEAFEGETVAEISPLDEEEHIFERGYGELMEVYTPLQLPGETEVMSVFEGYYDITDLRAQIDYTNRFLWQSIGVGFVFLYVSLFTLVRNASRKLTRQSEENAQLYRKAQERLAQKEAAEARTQHQIERLGALRSIDTAITSTFDLRLMLEVILEKVCEQLRVDAADVLLLDHGAGKLEYAGGRGFRSDAMMEAHLRLGEGYAGRAALERRTLMVPVMTHTGVLERAVMLAGEDFVSYAAVPLIAKGQVEGVLEIFTRERLEPDSEWLEFLETLAGQTAIAVDNATLFAHLQRSNQDLEMAYDTTLEGWSRALDLRDKETEGHSQRVTEMSVRLAKAMRVGEAELVQIRRGALLHDIGKMAIPDAILLKPGALNDEEWEIMRRHPAYAYEMLSPIEFLRPALDIPYCHHEKWDGTGYPRKLKGEQIPLAARIFAIVDVWDALRSDRPYRRARPKEMVYAYIREQAGRHFDPQVVEAFLKMLKEDATRSMHTQTLLAESLPLEVLEAEYVPVAVSGNGNRNGNGNGHANGNGNGKARSNGRGNGHKNGASTAGKARKNGSREH
jgi:HD-GYP domain-containing protein (c-di-GMP phosphodiesterase class II)